VRRQLLSQLRHRRGRFATLGLAILIAAGSFSVLTASACAASVHARQTLKQNLRGASSASISSAKQKVSCVSGVGFGRRQWACKTQMQLVCHKSPGLTVLRNITSRAHWEKSWHIDFSPASHYWGKNEGAPVNRREVSIQTARGARREEAIVSFLPTGPYPGTQVIISARCS
jgi:hypothetical protein